MKSPHGGFFGFMNNQGGTGNPVLDQLLAKLVGSGGVSQQQTQPVKDAASYYNNTNNDIMKSVQGMIQGGSGGYAVNAGPAAKAWDSNTAATAGIPLHLAENLNNNNSQLLGNLLNAATQQQGNAMNYGTQNRSLSLQYGENDPAGGGVNGSGVNGMQAIQEVQKQGGGDLLSGKSQAEQYKAAQDIMANGGVASFRKKNPGVSQIHPEDQRVFTNLNNGLTMSYQATHQLNKSKALQDIFDNSFKKTVAVQMLNSGHPELLKTLGLSDADITALQNMESVGKNSIATNSKLNIGLNNTSKANATALKQLNGLMYNQADAVRQHYGYGSLNDIPGFTALGGK